MNKFVILHDSVVAQTVLGGYWLTISCSS